MVRFGPVSVLVLVLAAVAVAGDEPDRASIDGRVTLYGFPRPARVELRRSTRRPGTTISSTRAAEDGTFRFDGLPPGEYALRAFTPEARGSTRVDISLPGERPRTVIRLRSADRILRGRVTWSDGSPFRGFVESGVHVVETDEEGRFDLPDTGRPLELRAEGRLLREVPLSDEWCELVADDGLRSVEGRVVAAADGRPISGVRLRSHEYRGIVGRAETEAVTDEDGRFRMLALAGGTIRTNADGWLPDVLEVPPAPGGLEFRLRPAPVVDGRAVSAVDGRPLPGVPVVLHALPYVFPGFGSAGPVRAACGITDESGRFRIVSPVAGDVAVMVLGGGYVTPGLERATPDGHHPAALTLAIGETRELTLTAVRSPALVGRLTDPAGHGVPGQVISAHCDVRGPSWTFWMMLFGLDASRTVTDEDGAFRIPTVLPDLCWLLDVSPSDRPGYVFRRVEPGRTRDTRADLVLPTLVPDRFVDVLVVSEKRGEPVAGARVAIGGTELNDFEGESETTGPDGRCRVGPFTRRPLLLGAKHPDFSPVQEVPVPGCDGDQAILAARVALPAGHFLEGVVRFPDGSPADGARFSLVNRSESRSHFLEHSTDAEGRFRVSGLADGEWEITVSNYEKHGVVWRGTRRAKADTSGIVVSIEKESVLSGPREREPRNASPMVAGPAPPTVAIGGRVLGPDGNGVRGARVSAYAGKEGRPDRRGAAYTDEAGRFRIDGLVDGEYPLRVAGPPDLREAAPFTARGGESEVLLRLAAAAAPRIEVLDPPGEPVRDVNVDVYPADVEPPLRWEDRIAKSRTDPIGVARLAHLDPGARYLLRLQRSTGRNDLDDLDVPDWKPADGTFRLGALRTLTGVVRDRDGFPIPRAVVGQRVVDDEGNERWREHRAGDRGAYAIRRLPLEPVHLRAGASGSPPFRAFAVPADENEKDLKIDGGPILIVRMERWPKGREATACVSGGWPPITRHWTVPVSGDGRMRLHDCRPERRFTVWVGLPGGLMAYGTDLEPDVEHVLPLVPGKSIAGRIGVPAGTRAVRLSLFRETLRVAVPAEPGGRFRIWSLPPGRYSLRAAADVGGVVYGGEAEAVAGETVELALAPK